MSIYFFFIGILLVGLGLFVRFKLQNNFKIGSDNFKKSRSVSYILLGIGIICICFYFIYALRAGSLKRLCPDGPLLYMGQLPARFRRILDRHKQRTLRFGTHQLMGSLTTGWCRV